MIDIIVKNGIQPAHSFDLWGPIVDAAKLGQKKIELYRQLAADQKIDPETVEKVIADYQGLLEGQHWATGERKGEIIDALQGPVKQAGLDVSYNGTFQEDGLYVMQEILDAGEGVIVFSSKPAPWLKENLPREISDRVGDVYADKKTDPEAFRRVFDSESRRNRRVISHTADELPELEAAVKSELFVKQGLIYVNRNDSNPPEAVHSKGIGVYVNDLRDVGYTKFVA